MQAANRRVIHLSALPKGMEVVIQRVSLRQVGLDAGMMLLDALDLGRIAAQNAREGGLLVGQVATTPPRPPEPARETSTALDPALRRQINVMVDRSVVMAGVVSPSFEELCRMYGADQGQPERGFGPDWDTLLTEIMAFSGDDTVGHVGTRGSPAQQEMFPDQARAHPR